MSDPRITEEARLTDDALREIEERNTWAFSPHVATDGHPYISMSDYIASASDVPRLTAEVRRGREASGWALKTSMSLAMLIDEVIGNPELASSSIWIDAAHLAARRALGGGDK
jgi:hypothetical protein